VVRKVDPVRGMWRIDLHMHTSVSPDSKTDPKALIERARKIGLNRIAVTDHNTIDGALEAHRLAPDLVIVGEEIETETGGELIAYYVQEAVPSHLPVRETIRRLREQGSVISISHPLDSLRGSALGEKVTLEIIEQVDALEVFNARCLRAADNTRAADLAKQYGKAVTAGSDSHTLGELGSGYLTLPPFKDTPQAFLDSLTRAIPGGRLSGLWPHFRSTLAKLTQ
jgi:predicted metal-dependent phosphoesterase TrpH